MICSRKYGSVRILARGGSGITITHLFRALAPDFTRKVKYIFIWRDPGRWLKNGGYFIWRTMTINDMEEMI